MAGGYLTAPFRAHEAVGVTEEAPLWQRLGEYLSIYPGGKGYDIYKGWKASPYAPELPVGIPSWEQLGAWAKPVLREDIVLRALDIDPSEWREPEQYEMAHLGMAETAEFAPLIFAPAGRVAKTVFEKATDIAIKQIGKGLSLIHI